MYATGDELQARILADPETLPFAPRVGQGAAIERRRAEAGHVCVRCARGANVAYIVDVPPDTRTGRPGSLRWLDLCHEDAAWLRRTTTPV